MRPHRQPRRAVEELARVERSGRHPHRRLHQARGADAGRALQGRAVADRGVAAQRRHPRHPGDERREQRRRAARGEERALAGERREGAREDESRRDPEQDEIDQRQRLRPLLDEAQAGVDHRRAVPEQHRHGDRGERQDQLRDGAAPLSRARATRARPAAMNAGSTITSRDSHEVRHIAAARQARAGRPRCRNDAARPAQSRTVATSEAAREEHRRHRQACQHARGRARRPGPARRRRAS